MYQLKHTDTSVCGAKFKSSCNRCMKQTVTVRFPTIISDRVPQTVSTIQANADKNLLDLHPMQLQYIEERVSKPGSDFIRL